MTAVIGPVSIQHTDFRHRRVSVFFRLVVILDMQKIFKSHRKSERTIQFFQICLCHICKSVKNLYVRRLFKYRDQGLRLLQSCLSGIYRIDTVVFHSLKLFLCQRSLDHIGCCCTDHRILIFFDKPDTLLRRIRSLIKLSRQIFHGKYMISFLMRKFFQIKIIYRKLRKHASACFFKCIL